MNHNTLFVASVAIVASIALYCGTRRLDKIQELYQEACRKEESMAVHRKRYIAEMKAKIVLEAIKGHKTANEIAAEYGVHPTQIAQWKKQALGYQTPAAVYLRS